VTFFSRDVLVGPPGDRRPRSGKGAQPFVLRTAGLEGRTVEVAPQILAIEPGLERTDAPRHYPDQDEIDRVRVAFPLPSAVPGFGCRLFEVHEGGGQPLESFAAADGALLWNGRVEFGLDRDGTGVMRRPGGGKPFSGLFGLESEADIGDTYTVCPRRGDAARHARRTGRARITAAGPLVAGLSWSLTIEAGEGARGKPGRVVAGLALDVMGDSPALGCRIMLDNAARNHRLRLRFPTGLTGTPALAGTAFGVVERPPVRVPRRRYPAETPVRTAPAHRFVAVARGERGLALFAPGFFEYEWTPKGDLLLTLLRSVGELSRSDLVTRPGHAGWPTPTPEAQCLGRDELRLGLAAVTAEDLAHPERLERIWEELFVPPVVHWIRDFHPAGDFAGDAGVTLEGEGLVLSALKPADDGNGIIVRCYSLRGAPVAGRIRAGRPLARASLVRADETEVRPLAMAGAGDVVEFPVPAYGLVSLRLNLAP
jgi:hypothetical protein